MRIAAIALVLALSSVYTGATLAQTSNAPAGTESTPRIDKRQANQQKRIKEGVASGELNKRETARIEKGQKRVQRMENRAVSDGKVSKKERARIEGAQDAQSARIAKQKNDGQTTR